MRTVLRRANILADEAESLLNSDEISAKDCQIVTANLEQVKSSQGRLDILITDISSHELTDVEEKQIEQVDTLVIKLARLTGLARSAQATLEGPKNINQANDPRRSWTHLTSLHPFSTSASSPMRNKLPKITSEF